MTLDLAAYLRRIGYTGLVRADLETLNALHAAHVNAVPFENLDVHAGRPVSLSLDTAYEEIVTRGKGGWCYEMNAVFGWALSEIGFEVLRLGGGCGGRHWGTRRWATILPCWCGWSATISPMSDLVAPKCMPSRWKKG